MLRTLKNFLGTHKVKDQLIDRVSYASDAGFYYLVPQAVVQPENDDEIKGLFQISRDYNVPLVFRGGGTSLSGQSITDGILVDLSKFWKKIQIEEDGKSVRVQPGITGSMVNAHLKPYKRKIGPDPSSIGAAMMGGILSNNASGMCCGVVQNSYHTLKYIRFILPDGNSFSTEVESDYLRFETECQGLAATLVLLREEILRNTELFDRIRHKYQTKNTVGYGLNAFIDYQKPLDIFAHLLIGGEGTLAFISEAVLETVPDKPHKSTGLIYFTDIFSACQAIPSLMETGAAMVELMDRASLRSVEDLDGMPAVVKTLPEPAAALLVEFQEDSIQELEDTVALFESRLPEFSLVEAPVFTRDPAIQAFYWKVRKGMFPAVGAVRASGTTVILEDVAFPLHHLGHAIIDIQNLFQKHGYENGIIFGHAKDGNIHFVVTQTFATDHEIKRYERFMDDVVNLVVKKYDGALKAEHGTGRNMAPFVETEWGGEAYHIMKRLKDAVDPLSLLNPGVIINPLKDAHLHNLKRMPSVEQEVDKCIECGFCEPSCPSRQVTASPRRRIVTRRVLENFKADGRMEEYKVLAKQFEYHGLDTCAVDGLCALNCPVNINTGDLVKHLRVDTHAVWQNKTALWTAKNFGTVVKGLQWGLEVAHVAKRIVGERTLEKITKGIPNIPNWTPEIPEPPALRYRNDADPDIVYFPACITRMMGTYPGQKKNMLEIFYAICDQVGIKTKVLDQIGSSCCSQIYSSKGFSDAYAYTANEIVERMWNSSLEGKLPIVIDVTSCEYTIKNMFGVLNPVNQDRYKQLTIWDSIEFLYQDVLPKLQSSNKKGKVVLHPVCSSEKMQSTGMLKKIAETFAEEVIVPLDWGCCGMAGDRGFLFPELTTSATEKEAREVNGHHHVEGHYSSTRTCEMAMTHATGKNYESILYLVAEGLGVA
ncbi:FAD linked oxidase domain protein [Leadbetterella byssophila DSM 17132]|uniref:D-lactate dehydrogenase (cytochrome) n=1 Tax=Leadbetterella byssophila (strain DSM 17132 / JCM 16389 / KACC 11308 / NBRC 106382 / 4M15) TaxID=649349 RepID=E4RXV2_LEAB4|nr:FAD-binding and (Fe-S)-binding domain-containing protein [Leadbetterella byssophila]ADQ19049.1 FAD linked oxidase domain protein [Leadbetterella byssophila DSM 17132]